MPQLASSVILNEIFSLRTSDASKFFVRFASGLVFYFLISYSLYLL